MLLLVTVKRHGIVTAFQVMAANKKGHGGDFGTYQITELRGKE